MDASLERTWFAASFTVRYRSRGASSVLAIFGGFFKIVVMIDPSGASGSFDAIITASSRLAENALAEKAKTEEELRKIQRIGIHVTVT
jgi:hypothetical protein